MRALQMVGWHQDPELREVAKPVAGPGEVLVSGAIPPLVLGSRIAFDDRGSHELKGVRDPWPVLAVRDARS